MNDAGIVIALTVGPDNLKRDNIDATTPLEARAKACFKEAHSERTGWMLGSDDECFRAGCGLLMKLSEGDELARVETELRMLHGLSAAQNGIPVDFAALIPDGFEAVGLLRIYNERVQ